MVSLVYMVFNLYALGLVALVVLSWVQTQGAASLKAKIEPFYAPLLVPIRQRVIAAKWGTATFDFSPIILLIGILVVRSVVVTLLKGL